MLSRRTLLTAGGLVLAGLPLGRSVAAEGAAEIVMTGRADGSRVWFGPLGLLIRPGGSVTWVNRDRGNSHTSTAYHPDNAGHVLRIPAGVAPWDSGYLLPDQSFTVRFEEPGIYDFYCVPHEHSGMVGRIVVAEGGEMAEPDYPLPDGIAADAFPPVATILSAGRV
jgi:plastocyanin